MSWIRVQMSNRCGVKPEVFASIAVQEPAGFEGEYVTTLHGAQMPRNGRTLFETRLEAGTGPEYIPVKAPWFIRSQALTAKGEQQ
jgi:hypothetical protein